MTDKATIATEPGTVKTTQQDILDQYTKALAAGVKKSSSAVQLGTDETTDVATINSWYEHASQCYAPEDLSKLARNVLGEYVHTPVSIVHASSAITLAAYSVIFASEQGKMDRDQRAEIMWTGVRGLLGLEEEPLKLTRYADLLFPATASKMVEIPVVAWEWVQNCAKESLEDPKAVEEDPALLEHWESIAKGLVPFGFTISKV